jgi:Copper/zinc superoxide dismutase (SODC)
VPSIERMLTFLFATVYHIHDQPVPASGNCTATLAHLDPYVRGEEPPCDPTAPQTCQVGDLSGKYGKIPGTGSFQASYLDLYTSTAQGPASFFGNRSIVVHAANKTRLTCANFQLVSSSGTGTGSVGGSNTTAISPPIASYTGAAAQRLVSGAAVVAGLLAFAL